ncbi:pentatricopeptide repeat-containing protein at5g15300 [Phtheirospermum japonicum]|uniref:Pentatricopeptide repeat-containing protein at5g15300 n=1 Tax=Phtheirospermum japonicum TaxID=374723 RepID=A0A830CYL7_9LAMI|nr:pentatricopeptide repeat-containing protein at5g15300 [Phtheirospermum japonicum]
MIRKNTTHKSSVTHHRSPLWRNCTNLRALKQIHAHMIVNAFNSDRTALTELIYSAAVSIQSTIDYAHQLFDEISEPDLFMWNTMLRGSAQSSKPHLTISLYSNMEKLFIKPDHYTFPFVLKACTRLSWANTGCAIHGKVTKHGLESNKFSRNALINFHANCGEIKTASSLFDGSVKNDVVAWSTLTAGYARRGDLNMARKLFDEMPVKDLVSWNVMITGYVKQREMGLARELFNSVPKRDVVTWNAMISGYVLSNEHRKALDMYEEMRSAKECPDEVTMLSLLSACANLGALEIGEKINRSILEMGLGAPSVFLGNALIDMYAKCGNIEKAFGVFRLMRDKDVTSWNSIIVGLAFSGCTDKSISIFEDMRKTKCGPNEITFVGLLIACSHSGRVDEGRAYFNLMRNVYNIRPNVKHYGCMVDLFGRAGLLDEAFEFIGAMKFEPNTIIWRTLLGACRVHCNVEMGRRANEELLKLRRDESGDYVLLSNIYASNGEWCGVENVRRLMDESGVKKERGFSLVDSSEFLDFLLGS